MQRFIGLIVFFLCLVPAATRADGIYSNGSSSEDSIVVSVFLTDSLGNPSQTQADSFLVTVLGPSGDSIITIAGIAATAGLAIDSVATAISGWRYVYTDAVADIDGAGRPGTYEISFCAKDNSPAYVNCSRASFRIIASSFNDQLASISSILDSVCAVLDTLRDRGEAAVPPASEIADSVWGHLLDIAWPAGSFGDSASGWGATAAGNLDSGTVQRIGNRRLDSLQATPPVGLASSAIDLIWDELQSGHTTAGSFGSYLDAPISQISSPAGSGSIPITLIAFDSLAGQVVPGVGISVYNGAITALLARGATGMDGRATVNLDTGLYVISGFAPGYILIAYDSLQVVGTKEDTLFCTRFDPGSPSQPSLCRVYGYFYGIDGQPMRDVIITVQLEPDAVRSSSAIISPYRRTAVSDSTGYFYIDLIPSSLFSPEGIEYLLSASSEAGTIVKKNLLVPNQATWLVSW
jgi:hypothetical protein